MSAAEIRVPDIGDFKDVPVIEVLVKPGDRVAKNDSLIALESEKATMEVPSPQEGTVESVKVNVGDKVSQGSVILTLAEKPAAAADKPAAAPEAPRQQGAAPRGDARSIELLVPDIGDFKDVPVIEVLIKPGDRVEKDASLITLESEKATMEVPATAAGIVADVKVRAGDKVSKGTPIATLTAAAAVESAPAQQRPAAPSEPEPQTRDVSSAKPTPPPESPISVADRDVRASNGLVHASPSIRRFARELGVDLHRVAPTGPNGRVTRDDVQQFVKRSLQDGDRGGASAPGAGLALAPWPKVDFAQYGEIERRPLARIKRISGANLQRNWVTIPHVTQNDDADVTDLEAFRNELNAEFAKSGVKVTMLAFLIKACVAALKKFPEFNSSLDGEELVFKRYYNIGFAADTPGGLVVPVIRNADAKGIAQLASESAELAAKARDGKLSPSEMQGGTFTISSLGSIGGTYFTPIINAPEVAILGACRATMRPVWNGTQFEPRLMQPLSLSYDHRVIDGAAAARFVTFLRNLLSDLRRALL